MTSRKQNQPKYIFYHIHIWYKLCIWLVLSNWVAQWVRSLGIETRTSLSPIRHGFALGFVNYKKWCTRIAAASDKVYQLLAHSPWFSLASSTTKNWSPWSSWDIVESGVKTPKINQSINIIDKGGRRGRDRMVDGRGTHTTVTPQTVIHIHMIVSIVMKVQAPLSQGSSWSYSSWINNYLSNQCLSTLTL